jgi:hypothetical protein
LISVIPEPSHGLETQVLASSLILTVVKRVNKIRYHRCEPMASLRKGNVRRARQDG